MYKKIDFKTLKYDTIFKNVILKYEDVFIWFINRVLEGTKYHINNYEILNCELSKDRVYIRNKLVDIFIHDLDNNYLFNIELNSVFDEVIIKRNYLYQSAQLVNSIHVNKDISASFKPVIQINLNFNSILKEKNEFIHRYTDKEIEKNDPYKFFKEIINVDIDTIIYKWYNMNKDKEFYEKYKHFLLIGMTKEDLLMLEDGDDMVKKIKNEIFRLNNDSNFYQFLTDEEDKEMLKNAYLEQGIEKGLIQGIEQNKIDNARKMKSENLNYDLIGRITGLDAKLIASL